MCSWFRYVLGAWFAFCGVAAIAASLDGVRFVASPSVIQMRMEITSSSGTTVFDSDWKSGSVLDWSTAAMPYGSYVVRIFTRDLDGRLAEKQTVLKVALDGMAIDPAAGSDLKLTLTAHDGGT